MVRLIALQLAYVAIAARRMLTVFNLMASFCDSVRKEEPSM
jgi:hypothetical protein